MKWMIACFIIVMLSALEGLSQQKPLETFRYSISPEDTKLILIHKQQNVEHTHSLLKGGIWDEILPNIVYIPTATYYVNYYGTDSNNPGSKKWYITVNGFYMLNSEVTNKMYRYFLADSSNEKYRPHYNTDSTIKSADLNNYFSTTSNGAKITLANYSELDDYPVIGISWRAANAFCRWLGNKAMSIVDYKKDAALTISFRLLTEANYEIAALMNEVDENATAEDLNNSIAKRLNSRGNSRINYGRIISPDGKVERKFDEDGYYFTNPVKKFAAGKMRLYGMQGNAAEWVADVFNIDPTKAPPNSVPYKGTRGQKLSPDSIASRAAQRIAVYENSTVEYYRSVVGGSWYDGPFYMQPCVRQQYEEHKGSERIGFRIAMSDLEDLNKSRLNTH